MVKGLFVPDASFTSSGIANAHDIWCRCEGTVTEKFVVNGGSLSVADLFHPSFLEQMGWPQSPAGIRGPTTEHLGAGRPAPAFLPGFDALPDLDEKPPELPDENTPIPDTATLRAVLLRYLPYAQAVIVRGATAPGTETTAVGVTARRILLERGYGKLANTIEIEGRPSTAAELHLEAVMALNQDPAYMFAGNPEPAAVASALSFHRDDAGAARGEGDPEDGDELWFSRARHRSP